MWKSRGTRDQITNILWIIKKQENFRKTSTFASLTIIKLLNVWITTNCGKFLKKRKYQTTLPASWETCMQVKKQQVELDTEQQTGSKSGKEYVKAIYCHPAYLTYMHHVKCWAGWITSWNQDCQEKYQQPQICRWYHPNGKKQRGMSLLMKGDWKSWLKTRHSKN